MFLRTGHHSDMVILFIILPLNSLLFSGVHEISCDLVELKAGITACEHVGRTRQKFRASVSQLLRDGSSFL